MKILLNNDFSLNIPASVVKELGWKPGLLRLEPVVDRSGKTTHLVIESFDSK